MLPIIKTLLSMYVCVYVSDILYNNLTGGSGGGGSKK